jgi:hypothetical protein
MADQQDKQAGLTPKPQETPSEANQLRPPQKPTDVKKPVPSQVSAYRPGSPDEIIKTAINQIEDTVGRGQKELWWFSVDGWKSYLPEIDKAARDCVDRLLTAIPTDPTAKTTLLDTVKERREKIPLSTGITDQIIGICQSLLSFGAGGLALSLAFIDKASKLSIPVQKYLAIAGIFYVELVIISILSLILYMLQARFRFPFLYFEKIGNAWPWFYYASISADVPRGPVQLSRARLNGSALYAKDFVRFTEKVLDEDYKKKLRNEIQQYFLLMSYQAYVNQFSLRLANFFMYGFVGAFITAVIMLLLVCFFGV